MVKNLNMISTKQLQVVKAVHEVYKANYPMGQ